MDTAGKDTTIDHQKVEAILEAVKLPPEFKHIDVQYRPDHDGDPSVYLTFKITDGTHLTDEDLTRLTRFMGSVVSSLYNSHVGGYIYDELDPAA